MENAINKSTVTAVILAGGKGSRIGGQDKGLITFNGKPMIEHLLERIRPQTPNIIINANRNQTRYQQYGYPVISDQMDDFQGPLAGFSSAIKAVDTDYILTLPCDGPLLPLDLLTRLMSAATHNQHNKPIVVHDGKRLQPVYALIPVTLGESLDQFLSEGGRQIRQWYETDEFITVDFSDSVDAFTNINTEQQRQTLENSL